MRRVLWFNWHQPITTSVFPRPCLLSACVSVSTLLSFLKDIFRFRACPHPEGAHLNLITPVKNRFPNKVLFQGSRWRDTIQLQTQSMPCFEVIFSQLNLPHGRIFGATVLNLDDLEIQGTCIHISWGNLCILLALQNVSLFHTHVKFKMSDPDQQVVSV